MVTDILITGYTEFLSDDFLFSAFPDSRVVIAGKTNLKNSVKDRISVHRKPLNRTSCRKLFTLYDFDQVVFFSSAIAPFQSIDGRELDQLALILEFCGEHTRLLYVAGPRHETFDSSRVLEDTAKEICRRNASRIGGINILAAPWVYAIQQEQSCITDLFTQGNHQLRYRPNQEMTFLSAEDLAILIFRMFEDWSSSLDEFYVPNVFVCTADDLSARFERELQDDSVRYSFSADAPLILFAPADSELRTRYMWFPIYSFMEDLPQIVKRYRENHVVHWWDHLDKIRSNALLVRAAELLVGFVLTELLLKLSGISIQFKMIDFRLLFIVLMGTMYNMQMGIAAAALESLSLVLAYSFQGRNWINLFYEPTNWLPFIAYFTVGAVCGYIRVKEQSLTRFAKDETQSLSERFEYLQKVNEDLLQEKQEYKQQIIGTRDSFGKIFDISQQLNQSHPKYLMSRALEIVESVMSNNTVAVYNCQKQSVYGRLSISSRGMNLPYSTPLTPYYERLESTNEGEVWVNRNMESDMPQYLYGIRRNNHIEVIILIQKADYSQMTLYYENLFRVICGLISNSLVLATEYQDAIHKDRCVENTERTLKEAAFLEELSYAVDAMSHKQAIHLLLKIDTHDSSIRDAEIAIGQCIRNSDVIGLIDGQHYLLLLQARENDLPFIGKRLQSVGLDYNTISMHDQAAFLSEKAG